MKKTKLIHVCFDEGGMFGNPVLSLPKTAPTPKRSTGVDDHPIGNFYLGKMTASGLRRFLQLWCHAFPHHKITQLETGEIINP